MDSGAAENVFPKEGLDDYPVKETQAKREGRHYVSADGGRIPNRGEKTIRMVTGEGHRCSLRFKIADVTRPILAVRRIVEKGHEVRFWANGKGGTIVNVATGQRTAFQKKGGVYVL